MIQEIWKETNAFFIIHLLFILYYSPQCPSLALWSHSDCLQQRRADPSEILQGAPRAITALEVDNYISWSFLPVHIIGALLLWSSYALMGQRTRASLVLSKRSSSKVSSLFSITTLILSSCYFEQQRNSSSYAYHSREL